MKSTPASVHRTTRSGNRRAPRQNIRRRSLAYRRRSWLQHLVTVAWSAAGLAGVIFVSLFFIFVHDVFTQSEHFQAHQIFVEGGQRLSPRTITTQAGVRPGINVLSVNLTAARKRLLAHPWIAEAAVQRELPSTLRIRIREHEGAAVVDIGRRFLLNPRGELFKEWESSDPAGLPSVSGLALSDVRPVNRSVSAGGMAWADGGAAVASPPPSRPMDAVMEVLRLGRDSGSVLPTRELRSILVDRELGLTLVAYTESRMIRLGYNDYPAKYRLLQELLAFFRDQANLVDFERIDLTDMSRIIVNPVKAELLKKTGPQGG